MEKALDKQLGKKPKAMALNMARARARATQYAARAPRRSATRTASSGMNKTAGQILVEGNAAAAMGCLFAGVTVVAWYPITPSSSLCETLIDYMRKYRMDKETGKATLRHRPGRGRDRGARHGGRRDLGGRALDDVDRRARASR